MPHLNAQVGLGCEWPNKGRPVSFAIAHGRKASTLKEHGHARNEHPSRMALPSQNCKKAVAFKKKKGLGFRA